MGHLELSPMGFGSIQLSYANQVAVTLGGSVIRMSAMSTENQSNNVTVAIAGAAGRMGQRLVALCDQTDGLQLSAAFDRAGHEHIGADSGQLSAGVANDVAIKDSLDGGPNVMIDFTLPEATQANIALCVERNVALIIGTTGLSEADHAAIDEAAKSIPVVQAPNMSLGVNLLFALAARTAARLGDDYDIEIVEAHHRYKKDAPSGTAMGIAEAICKATDKDINKDLDYGRHGDDEVRERGTIGMHAVRIGDCVGEHSAYFAALGERIELRHVATTRDTFARGALRAALWIHGKPAGRYTMADVLGLNDE